MWAFDESLEQWNNDGNNWGQKWNVQSEMQPSAAICLLAKSTALVSVKKSSSLFVDDEESDASSNDVQARLWSPKIRAQIGMRCLTLVYSIHMGSSQSRANAGLALLQRQEGCLTL